MREWPLNQPLPRPSAESERGANLAEYGLLVTLIALVCFIAVQAFGSTLQATYERIAAAIPVP